MAKPGKLTERITFEENTSVSDGLGGVTDGWAAISSNATVWAQVFPSSGREESGDGRINATGVYVFVIRNRSDIQEAYRLVWQGENYNIRQIKRVSARSMYLTIEAERGAAV